MRGIRGMRDGERRRYGDILLEMVRRGMDKPSAELPRPTKRKRLPKQKELTRALQQMVARIGAEQGIAPEILARKKAVEDLIYRVAAGTEPRLPPELEGWRRTVIGEPMLDFLTSA